MTTLQPTCLDELAFELRDVDVFTIPDVQTRIATVQNYFFPRLDLLVLRALDLVAEVYAVEPLSILTVTHRPNNRRIAAVHRDFDVVLTGVTGRRRTDRVLSVRRLSGQPLHFHPTRLTFTVFLWGAMRVELIPFQFTGAREFRRDLADLVHEHRSALDRVLELLHISHGGAMDFQTLAEHIADPDIAPYDVELFSPTYYFPAALDRGLWDLVLGFVGLYPLLDASILLAEGAPPRLPDMLDRFRAWWLAPDDDASGDPDEPEPDRASEPGTAPLALDSYAFIRPRVWWSVLARDGWTCQACGRTARNGVPLEVDHIVPRSLGGADDVDNLQTLCRKCNAGKSNTDRTDLRAKASSPVVDAPVTGQVSEYGGGFE